MQWAPSPVGDILRSHAVFMGVGPVGQDRLLHALLNVGGAAAKARNPVNRINKQVETADLIVHRQFQRGIDIAFLLVSVHMEFDVVAAVVGESVDQLRAAVKIKDHSPVCGEQTIEVSITEAVGVFRSEC